MESFTGVPSGNVFLSEGILTGTDGMTNEQREYRDRHEPCVYCNKREGEWVGTVCPKCEKLRVEWQKYFNSLSRKNKNIDEEIKKIQLSLDFQESISLEPDGSLRIHFEEESYGLDELSKRLTELKKNKNDISKSITETQRKIECLEKQKITIKTFEEWMKCREERTSGQSGLKRN